MYRKNILQIQPGYDRRDEWAALAREEDLSYEVIELSMPPALNESGRFKLCEEWYQSCKNVTSLHGNFIDVNPASGDAYVKEASRKRCHESCLTAKKLGAERIVFHSSCYPYLRGAYLDNWSAQCAEFYAFLAEEYDLEICIENCADPTPYPLVALMERCENNKRIGICLDLGHVNYSHVTMEQWFEELGQWISYIHLSDNIGHFDDHLTLGKGNVNWKKADSLYRELGRTVPLTFEVGDLESVKISLKYLKDTGYFLL